MTLDPAAAVSVPPLQVANAFAGVAITNPAGRSSLTSRLSAAAVLAVLSIVRVNVLLPPNAIGLGPKLFPNPGGGFTVSVALAVPLAERRPAIDAERDRVTAAGRAQQPGSVGALLVDRHHHGSIVARAG